MYNTYTYTYNKGTFSILSVSTSQYWQPLIRRIYLNIKYEKGWVESSQDTELKDRTKLAGGSRAGLESAMLGLYL